jgi:hypothetical protein
VPSELSLDIVNPFENARWDDLIISNPYASVFHSTFWGKVLADTYGFEPRYLIQLDGDKLDLAVPLMIATDFLSGRRAISLPFSDYCGPLLGEGRSVGDALNLAYRLGRKAGWRSIEVRVRGELPEGIPSSSVFFEHVLDLQGGVHSVRSRFKEATRRNIQKAERCGVSVQIGTSDDSMATFYELNCLTRREHGLPPQPLRFFRNLSRSLQSDNRGFVAIGYVENIPIAGAVFLRFGNKAIFKYGASNRKYQSLRANNLVMAEAIYKLSTEGSTSLCFGRTDLENEGLRRYKCGWGANEERISYAKFDYQTGSYVRNDFVQSTLSKTFFRQIPSSLSRTIGDLIYRYMA